MANLMRQEWSLEVDLQIEEMVRIREEGAYILGGKKIFEYDRERTFCVEEFQGNVCIYGLGGWFNSDGTVHHWFDDYISEIYHNGEPCYRFTGATWYSYEGGGKNVFPTLAQALEFAKINFPQFKWRELKCLPPSSESIKIEDDGMPF